MIRISDNMVLKPDQQRVKSLIQETLTLLCKNGLHYDLEFTIDAVIGVTLDKSNLFYMSIAETVTGGGAKTLLDTESLEDVHGTAISDEPQPNHVPKQTPSKPKKRKQLKKEEEESPVVGTQASSEINYGAEDHDVDLENLLEVGESPKAKKPRIITPSVHLPVKSDNETGTVYVKQEMVDDDSWAGEGGNDTFCESEGEASMTSFDHSTPGPSHRNASHSGVYTGSDGDQSRDGQWASMLTDEGSLTQSMVAASDQSITESDQRPQIAIHVNEKAEFFTSNKGRPKLARKGYCYVRDRQRGTRGYWRCDTNACNGRAVTDGDFVISTTVHTHPSDVAKTSAKICISAIKARASSFVNMNNIIDEESGHQDPSVHAHLPKRDSLKRSLQRQRQRLRPTISLE